MIKLIKLIYVNLLGLFDFNEMIVTKKSGVKSSVQNRNILYVFSALLIGYVIYVLFTSINFEDKYNILLIGYMLSIVICFITDFMVVGNAIFKSEDSELLFSLPIDRSYIIFSKLFNVYLKNIIYVAIIMISSVLSFAKFIQVSETLGLVLLVSSLLIPCIPIVISSLVVYFHNLFNVKYGKLYKIIISLLILLSLGSLFLIIRLVGIDFIIKNILFIFPINYLFYESCVNYNIICFIILVLISIVCVYLYSLCMNRNYEKIVSSLKGVVKKTKFKYKKSFNLSRLLGNIRKDSFLLFNNKKYFMNSFGTSMFFSIMLIVCVIIVPNEKINKFSDYEFIKIWIPNILAMVAALGNSTMYSISLEKDGRYLSGTMPINLFKYLFSKWFVNVMIGSLFVLINSFLVSYIFDISGNRLLIVYLFPLMALMLNSLIGLFLDSFFLVKNCNDDNVIMKQRFVTLVPSIVALFIGFLPLFTSNFKKYIDVQGAYILAMFVIFLIILIVMIINNKKIRNKIFF